MERIDRIEVLLFNTDSVVLARSDSKGNAWPRFANIIFVDAQCHLYIGLNAPDVDMQLVLAALIRVG